jgi:hypothetical protein
MMKLAKPFYAGLSNLRTIAGIEAFNVHCRRINDPRRVLIDFTPHLGGVGDDIRVIWVAGYA